MQGFALPSSPMAENPKMQCLDNDLVRRLLNTKIQS